jgi:hypothetical protein
VSDLLHRGVAYRQVALEDCLALGESLRGTGRQWHSHVLSPDCRHNPFGSHYAIVIEDDTAGAASIAEGTTAFPEVDRQLVKMLHGDDILDSTKVAGGAEAARSSLLLAHIMALQSKGLRWHHHVHFPTCVFNPHSGTWSITVEADNSLFSEAFAEEPLDTIREIQVIYFENLGRTAS